MEKKVYSTEELKNMNYNQIVKVTKELEIPFKLQKKDELIKLIMEAQSKSTPKADELPPVETPEVIQEEVKETKKSKKPSKKEEKAISEDDVIINDETDPIDDDGVDAPPIPEEVEPEKKLSKSAQAKIDRANKAAALKAEKDAEKAKIQADKDAKKAEKATKKDSKKGPKEYVVFIEPRKKAIEMPTITAEMTAIIDNPDIVKSEKMRRLYKHCGLTINQIAFALKTRYAFTHTIIGRYKDAIEVK